MNVDHQVRQGYLQCGNVAGQAFLKFVTVRMAVLINVGINDVNIARVERYSPAFQLREVFVG